MLRRRFDFAERPEVQLRLMLREQRSVNLFPSDVLALPFDREFAVRAIARRLFSSLQPRFVLLMQFLV